MNNITELIKRTRNSTIHTPRNLDVDSAVVPQERGKGKVIPEL
jgi:hypothetical protein